MPIVDNELVSHVPMESFESPNVNVGDYFLDRVKRNIAQFGDAQWIHDISTGKSMTYTEMVDGVTSMASALRKRGLQVGDTVLLMTPNFVEVVLTFLGVWKVGGACACLTLNLSAEDIKTRAADSNAKFILTDETRANRVLEAVKDLKCVEEVFVIGQSEGCTSVYELLQDDGKDCPERSEIDMDSLAWLMYSSGTTGTPKGIVHTHRNITALIHNGSKNPTPGIKMLFINYMINSGGNTMFLMFTSTYSSINVISDFHDEELLKAIDKVKPLWVSCFPSQIASICRHGSLDQFDLKSVIFISTTGSGIYPKYELEIFRKIPNMKYLNTAYGMSEASLIATNMKEAHKILGCSKEEAIQNHVVGSVGKVMPFVRVKVVDEITGEKLGPNKIGEICVKSPYLLKEYRNNPKATKEAIREGWLHTGDKGYYNNDENIFIIGRFKELIKYRMAHVVPTNIEKQMMKHPAIEEVGVVGLPDEADGERPLAFVVLRKGQTATAEELINYTNDLVIDEEKLRGGVRFIDKIPRNELGKIIRPELHKLMFI